MVFGRVCFKEMLRPSCIGFCWLANLKQDLDGCGLQAGRQLSAETGGFPQPQVGFLFFLLKFPVLSWFKVGDWLIHPGVERSGGTCFFGPEKVTSIRRKEKLREISNVQNHYDIPLY